MKFTLRVSEKRPLKVFKVDKSFQTKSEVTKRTVEVAEAFGIGVDEEKTFTIFKDFTIDVNPGDVVYITGESGSGKSVLLRDLADQMEPCKEFRGVVREQDLHIDPEGILVESVGRDTNGAIEVLSLAGLNEAFLFLRRYRELSDGQKYRFKIAKMLDSGKGTWVLDEFCATLDRITAKVVAYCVQKVARRKRRTLLVATTHEDLLEDLNPGIHISKRFGYDVSVNTRPYQPKECSLLKDVEIRGALREEFQRIEHFHYKGTLPKLTLKIYSAYIHGDLAAAIAYSPPYFSCRGRSLALPSYKTHRMTSEAMKRVNEDFTRISRFHFYP